SVDLEAGLWDGQNADDSIPLRPDQGRKLDAKRVLAQSIVNSIQLLIRRLRGNSEEFLRKGGIRTRQHIVDSLPINESREQHDAHRECTGGPAECRGADNVGKLHGE